MNETLQQALVSIITKVTSSIDTSVTFLSQQIPDVIQQLLVYNFWMSIIQFTIAMIIFIILVTLDVKLGIWLYKTAKESESYSNWDIFTIGYCALGSIIRSIYLVLITSVGSLTWIQIWLAPKLYLMEYAAKLVK